jgi:hypothetical protein
MPGLPGNVILLYIVPLDPARGGAGHVPVNSLSSALGVRVSQKFIRILFFPQHVIQFDVGQGSKDISFYPMVLFAHGLNDLFDLLPLCSSGARTPTGADRQMHGPSKLFNLFFLQKG